MAVELSKVAGLTAIGIVVLSTTCAYAFARMKFKGKTVILRSMLIFQMFPAVLALVALYALFDRLGTYVPFLGLNTHGGVVFAYMGGIALHVWTIKGYFESIDNSLEEAAALDGATLASIPLSLVAIICANSCGGVYLVIYCRSDRSTSRIITAA